MFDAAIKADPNNAQAYAEIMYPRAGCPGAISTRRLMSFCQRSTASLNKR